MKLREKPSGGLNSSTIFYYQPHVEKVKTVIQVTFVGDSSFVMVEPKAIASASQTVEVLIIK